jgi:hypothetical protein
MFKQNSFTSSRAAKAFQRQKRRVLSNIIQFIFRLIRPIYLTPISQPAGDDAYKKYTYKLKTE